MRHILLLTIYLVMMVFIGCGQTKTTSIVEQEKILSTPELEVYFSFVKAFGLDPIQSTHIKSADVRTELLSPKNRGLVFYAPHTKTIVFPSLKVELVGQDTMHQFYVLLAIEEQQKLAIRGQIGGPHLAALAELAIGFTQRVNGEASALDYLFPIQTIDPGRFVFEERSQTRFLTAKGEVGMAYQPLSSNNGQVKAIFKNQHDVTQRVTIDLTF